jgi:copper(I)-binding protein
VAERAEIHEHRMDHGVMRMRQVTGGVEVVASKKIVFEPGGLHVMLIGLKHPLKEGESFPLTLRFQKAGVEQVTVAVQKPGAMGPRDGRSEAHDTHTPGS